LPALIGSIFHPPRQFTLRPAFGQYVLSAKNSCDMDFFVCIAQSNSRRFNRSSAVKEGEPCQLTRFTLPHDFTHSVHTPFAAGSEFLFISAINLNFMNSHWLVQSETAQDFSGNSHFTNPPFTALRPHTRGLNFENSDTMSFNRKLWQNPLSLDMRTTVACESILNVSRE